MGAEFEKVCLIGVGLIGGSLCLDAKDARIFGSVVGCGRSKSNLEKGVELGVIDGFDTDPAKAAKNADLVILASPVASFDDLAAKIKPALKKGAVVTDVGSVKGELVARMEKAVGNDAAFVGAHPVAGSEKSGAEASVRGLFKGKRCVITPTKKTDPAALKRITKMWRDVGMIVSEMDPFEHDRVLAATSHLPHFVAYALVEALRRFSESKPDALDYAAGGFHDFTRIALSSPEMWRDIFLLNSKAALELIDLYEKSAGDLKKAIRDGDGDGIIDLLRKSKATKEAALKKRPSH